VFVEWLAGQPLLMQLFNQMQPKKGIAVGDTDSDMKSAILGKIDF
jgi:hypothetical protein